MDSSVALRGWLVWASVVVVLLSTSFISVGAESAKEDTPQRRYLLYTVNHGEGFNAARDFYHRTVQLVQLLSRKSPWTLV